MGKIAVLSPALASQIAAGEVVERPASVVKELVENAIDAEARRCDVEIEGGGVTLIRIRDDGFGMGEEDVVRAVERHATSKLRSIDDLRQIGSFGFRGEALPSIASVSRLTLRSRTESDDAGTEVFVEGTAEPQVTPIGMAVGTEVCVRDLFFNVPARRKFLRSTGTESGHVTDVIEGLALARPDLSFTLRRDGRQVREWLRSPDREQRAHATVDDDLIACAGQRGPLAVEAYLSRPDRARMGAGGLKLLVNGRTVRDRAVLATVAQSYGSVLERGRYPRGVIYLDIPPELLDVNVHPQKAEVRFADPRAVTDAVYGILSRQLAEALSTPVPARSSFRGASSAREPSQAVASFADQQPKLTQPQPAESDPWGLSGNDETDASPSTSASPKPVNGPPPASDPREPISRPSTNGFPPVARTGRDETSVVALELPVEQPIAPGVGSGNDAAPLPSPIAGSGNDAAPLPSPMAGSGNDERGAAPMQPTADSVLAVRDPLVAPLRPSPKVAWAHLRFVAQVRQTYLVCEGEEGLYVIDQHAASERVQFSKLRREYRDGSVASQSLLFPLTIEVTGAEVELVEQHNDEIAAVGLEVHVRGLQTLSIHAVPQLLRGASPERLVRDLLSELSKSGGRAFSDAVDLALARMACHGAVRAGDTLTRETASALILALDDADFAGFCAHGRPVVAFTAWGELERKVGRR